MSSNYDGNGTEHGATIQLLFLVLSCGLGQISESTILFEITGLN